MNPEHYESLQAINYYFIIFKTCAIFKKYEILSLSNEFRKEIDCKRFWNKQKAVDFIYKFLSSKTNDWDIIPVLFEEEEYVFSDSFRLKFRFEKI